MPGLRFNSSTSAPRLRETFRTYARWYTEAHPDANFAELTAEQSRKYATELYVQTAAAAPSPAQIAEDVRALGWKIPAKFKDGRLGRGWPAQWTGTAYLQMLKLKLLKKKRGRNASAANQAQENAIRDAKPTLQQMQDFVIQMRTNARLYLASGWLGAILDLGGSTKATSGKVDPERGGADIVRSAGRVDVVIWNETPGIATVNDEKQFVEKAIVVRTADMWVYIRRKMEEAARRYFRAST